MKNYKKILAGVLATSMVLGNSAVVFADEGGQAKGSGKVEGQVKNEVFSVVLPTESDYAGAFDYIIDPLQLIKNDAGNNGNKYDKTKFDFDQNATVFFYNGYDTSTPAKMKYTETSNALKVENKSSMPVKVGISLKASEVDGITFTSDNTFASDTNTSLYLGIVEKGFTLAETAGATATALTSLDDDADINSNGIAKLEVTLPALAPTNAGGTDKAFVTQWNPVRNAYEFVANTAVDKTTTYCEFQVTGKCNTATGVDWLDILAAGETPELEIMWSIQDPTGAQIELDQSTKTVKLKNLTPEQGYKSLILSIGEDETYSFGNYEGAEWKLQNWSEETASGEIDIVYAAWWNDYLKDKLVTITLNLTDGSNRSVTFVGQ
ncbi:MAG: hypothetical protein K1W27_14210 [Lachnospiraceae bacterium]